MNESSDVIVIGGGVIGAACAEYLTRAGQSVTILEKDRFGSACSAGNCGLLCPSHVLPLAEPGAITKTLKLIFKRNSPFAIRPRFDPTLWAWFLRFARRCNRSDMLAAGKGIHALLGSSMHEYDQLLSTGNLDAEYETRGLLFVYRTAELFEKFAKTDTLLRDQFGVGAEQIQADRLIEFEPSLKPGAAGAWWYGEDAHLRPESLMCSWRRSLETRGVRIIENCTVDGFVGSGTASAVRTSQGELTASAFVLATGALAPRFASALGCRLPIQPGKGYSITMPRPTVCPKVPMIFMEEKVVVTPFASGYRLGSTMEFSGYDASIRPERLELLRRAADLYLREPYTEPIEDQWFGWRPMTYDGLPIIDRSPKLPNVWITAGHNMLGLSMAPATGKLLSELVTETQPHVDPTPYQVSRF